jgi:hypothetical protein
LNFVDDHQSSQRAQNGIRLVEAGKTQWVFEVEVVERVRLHELPGKSRLAALARAQECDHPAALQSRLNLTGIVFAVDHDCIIYLENPVVNAGFSRSL